MNTARQVEKDGTVATAGVSTSETSYGQTDIVVRTLSQHWLLIVNLIMGVFVALPWLAPVLMANGYDLPAKALYLGYSLTCHQLPERSYFLFGPKVMYSMTEIASVWPSQDMLIRRQFIGTPAMGYKVAWSDRMVSMYTAMFVGGLVFALVRRRMRPLHWRLFVVVGVLPIFLDGFSHMINDLSGWGFRDSNAWFAALTGHILPTTFYAGDAIGSLNWWLRLVTGLLFGFAAIWLAYPVIGRGLERPSIRN